MSISISCSFILYFYVTNLALWLQDFNKLTYLLTYCHWWPALMGFAYSGNLSLYFTICV